MGIGIRRGGSEKRSQRRHEEKLIFKCDIDGLQSDRFYMGRGMVGAE